MGKNGEWWMRVGGSSLTELLSEIAKVKEKILFGSLHFFAFSFPYI